MTKLENQVPVDHFCVTLWSLYSAQVLAISLTLSCYIMRPGLDWSERGILIFPPTFYQLGPLPRALRPMLLLLLSGWGVVLCCWSPAVRSQALLRHNEAELSENYVDHLSLSSASPTQSEWLTMHQHLLPTVLKKDTRGPLRFHCFSGSGSSWPWILDFFPSLVSLSAVISVCDTRSTGSWLAPHSEYTDRALILERGARKGLVSTPCSIVFSGPRILCKIIQPFSCRDLLLSAPIMRNLNFCPGFTEHCNRWWPYYNNGIV